MFESETLLQVNTASNELFLGPERRFAYDCVYGPNTGQEEVYLSSLEPLLTTLLDGYNVSVILYGASGTGKTHTMMGPGPGLGPVLEEESFGLIHRSVRSLFGALTQLQMANVQCGLEVEYVEISNDEIRDLLSDNLSTVYLDQAGMTGVSSVGCGDTGEVLACLELGHQLHTQCRELSRTEPAAHTVFSLKLRQQSVTNTGLTVLKQSRLDFVDLAPSDQVTLPGGGTNLGLLSLGNVISALGDPRRNVSVVPHHDSLLTRVLAPALGGASVSLILATVSALSSDCEETLGTLMVASRAANIMNNPVPNIVSWDCEPPGMMSPGYLAPQYPPQPQFNNYLSPVPQAPYDPVKSPLSSTSPLSYKSGPAPLQLYLPPGLGAPRPLSPPGLPGNQGHLISGPGPSDNLSALMPASHNLAQDGIIEDEEMFRLQFAASQYKALVSSAGELLRNISLSSEQGEKKEIESWICKKEESENVIKKSGAKDKPLGKIVEESEDDSEVRTSDLSSETSGSDNMESEVTSEDSDGSDIDERLEVYNHKFRDGTDLLIEKTEMSYLNLINESEVQTPLETISNEEGNVNNNRILKSDTAHVPIKEIDLHSRRSIEEEYKAFNSHICDLQQKLSGIQQVIGSNQSKTESIHHLENCLSDLKNQHEKLKLRLSSEESLKKELQVQVQKDQEFITELQKMLSHQQRLLQDSMEASKEMSEKQEWLKQEEERIANLRRSAEELEQSLIEKQRLAEVNRIQDTSQEPKQELIPTISFETSSTRLEIEDLRGIRNFFYLERQKLDEKLNEQQLLSSKEERQLVELDESIEAIDSAIEFKNEILCNRNMSYEQYKGDDILMKRLVKLNVQETRSLLHKYFKRVLDLRMEGKKMEIHLEEVEDQYNDLGKYARELGRSLQRAKLDCERKLRAQEKAYQVKYNSMAQELADQNSEKLSLEYNKRLKSLEKELYRYKNMCKELKRSAQKQAVAAVNPAYTRTEEASLPEPDLGHETSRPVSVVSSIQPNHIEMFQRRLAKLQRKMGDSAKPTVTREQRKIIIENPVSASNSVEKKSDKQHRRKR